MPAAGDAQAGGRPAAGAGPLAEPDTRPAAVVNRSPLAAAAAQLRMPAGAAPARPRPLRAQTCMPWGSDQGLCMHCGP